jgi:hypothetical protein
VEEWETNREKVLWSIWFLMEKEKVLFLKKTFLSFFECFKNRNSEQFTLFLLYLSNVCESHLWVFVPSNYTEKGLKARPVVRMEIYMHQRIIIVKAARRKDSEASENKNENYLGWQKRVFKQNIIT